MRNPTFGVALQAVGTAAALATAGVYLHRSKYVTMDNKIVLARYSQQIAIPALFFSKFIPCPKSSSYREQSSSASAYDQYADEDGSASSFCPSVWQHVVLGRQNAWILLLWPLFVVSCGLLVGMIAVRVTRTPEKYRGAALAATAFANSSGLPLTLLAAIMAHAGPGDRGNASSRQSENPETNIEMDPNIFLTFYLCTYPILQWGLGGWLISQRENGGESMGRVEVRQEAIDNSNSRVEVNCGLHVNCRTVDSNETQQSTSAMDVKTAYQAIMTDHADSRRDLHSTGTDHEGISFMMHADQGDNIELGDSNSMLIHMEDEEMRRLILPMVRPWEVPEPLLIPSNLSVSSSVRSEKAGCAGGIAVRLAFAMDCSRCTQILGDIAIKAWQPSVMGAVTGLFVASMPALRSLLVVMQPSPANHRPLLQWVFDAIVAIGQSAVPVNMTVLGANLSLEAATAMRCNPSIGRDPRDITDDDRVPFNHAKGSMLLSSSSSSSVTSAAPSINTLQQSTIAAVVVGKLLIMPLIGISSTILLRRLVPLLFANQSPSFYLVLMLVFATPTATNVMVISDIYKGEQGMARLIGCQYIAAPIFLALSLMAILRVSGF